MKILLDTSVLVAGMIESHIAHHRADLWLEKIRNGDVDAIVSAHTLAEVYSVMTRLPTAQRVSPAMSLQLIERDILNYMEVVALTSNDYRDLIRHLSQVGIAGGAVFDGVIACAAAKARVDHIITLNARDFRRVYPALAASVIVP